MPQRARDCHSTHLALLPDIILDSVKVFKLDRLDHFWVSRKTPELISETEASSEHTAPALALLFERRCCVAEG